MDWVRMSEGFDHHPQVLAAGWHGSQLFLLLLRISRRFRLEGMVTAKYLEEGFIRRYWGCPADFPVADATDATVTSGLCIRQPEGGVLIDAWERWARDEDPTSTERSRRFRERQRTGNGMQRVQRVEERRGEERKGEESETLSVGTDPTIPGVGDLQRLWNELAEPAGLPLWKETGTGRMRSAKSRLRERPSMPEWRRIIERIATSTFCRGESGRGEWRASPDWLLRPDTAAKVLEGKYDDRAPPKPASQSYVEDRRPKPTMTEEEVRELFARSAAQRNGTG